MVIQLKMLAFRIIHKKYGDPFFAPGIEGRWNSAGKKVLYCSESIPLAFMESMIRRQGVGFNKDFVIVHLEIPEGTNTRQITVKNLKAGWDDPYDYSKCQLLSDKWFDEMESLVLKVPSAILNVCSNFVINTMHPEYKHVKLIEITPLLPDARIEALLKHKLD